MTDYPEEVKQEVKELFGRDITLELANDQIIEALYSHKVGIEELREGMEQMTSIVSLILNDEKYTLLPGIKDLINDLQGHFEFHSNLDKKRKPEVKSNYRGIKIDPKD